MAAKPPKISWVLFEIETFFKNCQKNLLYHPGSSFTELKNVLKIDKKPPKTSWVFFDIEKCAKIVKKKLLKDSGSSLQN